MYLGMLYLTSFLYKFYALKKQYPFILYSEHVVTMYETSTVEKLKFCSCTLQCRSFQLVILLMDEAAILTTCTAPGIQDPLRCESPNDVYKDHEGLFGIRKIYLGYTLTNTDCLP